MTLLFVVDRRKTGTAIIVEDRADELGLDCHGAPPGPAAGAIAPTVCIATRFTSHS